jgi:hypothetical protein
MKHEFPFLVADCDSVCDICHLARHKKLPYKLSVNKATTCGELIHFDIWGPNSIHSIHGHIYFLTAVDDFSRFTWVILLKSKSEVSLLVQQFITMIEKQFSVSVKIVRTDNGPEFLIPSFYANKGIIHQTSCVENPQQNGRVERKHQHLLNVGRSLLFQSKLPKKFWSYAVIHATYLINRVTTPLLNNKSPYHLLYNQPPNLEQLKVFGSLCYASTLHVHRTKLDPRARKCVFLGYKHGVKGVVLFDLIDKKVFLSRDVVHYDHILPYQNSTTIEPWTYHSIHSQNSDISTPIIDHTPTSDHITPPINTSTMDNQPTDTDDTSATLPVLQETIAGDSDSEQDNSNTPQQVDNPATPPLNPYTSPLPATLRRSSRAPCPPPYLSDYLCNL